MIVRWNLCPSPYLLARLGVRSVLIRGWDTWAPVVADRKGGGGGQRPCGTPGRLTGSVRASPIGPRAGRGLAGQEEAREMSFISEGEIWPSGRLTFGGQARLLSRAEPGASKQSLRGRTRSYAELVLAQQLSRYS